MGFGGGGDEQAYTPGTCAKRRPRFAHTEGKQRVGWSREKLSQPNSLASNSNE